MIAGATALKFLLDEGIPDSVAAVLGSAGHEVLLHRRVLAAGSPDVIVCQLALVTGSILVAMDGDMRQIAKDYGIGGRRFAKLNLLQLACIEPKAAQRVQAALSLLMHEWIAGADKSGRRFHVEISDGHIKTIR